MRVQQAGYIGEVFLDGTWTISREGQILERGDWVSSGEKSRAESVRAVMEFLEGKIQTYRTTMHLVPVA